MADHNELGKFGEQLVAQRLSEIAPVEPAQAADLRWQGIEIEVKTSTARVRKERPNSYRYQFCLQRKGHCQVRAPIVVLVAAAPAGFQCYIVPADQLRGLKHVYLGPRGGRLEKFRERWEIIYQEAMKNGRGTSI
jgi:hypothetical protein